MASSKTREEEIETVAKCGFPNIERAMPVNWLGEISLKGNLFDSWAVILLAERR